MQEARGFNSGAHIADTASQRAAIEPCRSTPVP